MSELSNDILLRKLVRELSKNFKQLEELIKENEVGKVDITFPRGVIRRAQEYRVQLLFIENRTLRRNIAYRLMLNDVYRWVINRFDIALTAKEMIIKDEICLFGNIIAATIINLAQKMSTNSEIGFKTAITILAKNGIIEEDFKKELLWVWGIRNKEHLQTLKDTEYDKYKSKDYDRTIKIWNTLIEQLTHAKENGVI